MARLLLIVRIGSQSFALPAQSVERILPMAALIPIASEDSLVVGLLNLQGTVLPVLDPRPLLGLAGVGIGPEQHLVVVSGASRFLLWVEQAMQMVHAGVEGYAPVRLGAQRSLIPFTVQLDGETVPVLSVEALEGAAGMLETSGAPR